MRNFFRVINSALAAAALLAASFAGYMCWSVWYFPVGKYEERLEELAQETEEMRVQTVVEQRETEELLAFLSADLRNNGEDALALADSIDDLEAAIEEKTETLTPLREELAFLEDFPGGIAAAREDYGLKIRELEEKILAGETDLRICYWTLDDGPTFYTADYLDALDALGPNVHVTFFTSSEANAAPNEKELLRREMTSGHSVQNHTFSHVTDEGGEVYRSLESFREQVTLQDDWLFEATGFHPGIFRFPGGYSSWAVSILPEATEVLEEMGYKWIDWNCNLYDAGKLPSVELEIDRAVTQATEEQIAVILSHDWNKNTLEALKTAIPMLQERGYVFLPLFPESVTMGMAATR